MSQLIVQIYKLPHTALGTKARVVKVKHDLSPSYHSRGKSEQIFFVESTQKRTAARRMLHHCVVRGAGHSGKN